MEGTRQGNQREAPPEMKAKPKKKKETGSCERCHKHEAQDEHTCPYQEEINDDKEYTCTCCKECEEDCAMDI